MSDSLILQILENDAVKEQLIKKVNKHLNIPMITEATEKEVYTALYEIFIQLLVPILDKHSKNQK